MKAQCKLSSNVFLATTNLIAGFFTIVLVAHHSNALAEDFSYSISQSPPAQSSIVLKRPSNYTSTVKVEQFSFINSNKTYFGKEENSEHLTSVGVQVQRDSLRSELNVSWSYIPEEEFHYFNLVEYSRAWPMSTSEKGNDVIRVGRHLHEWSKAESFWHTDSWQPQYRWDRFSPQSQGLSGIFYEHEIDSSLKVTSFFTDFFMPSIAMNYREEDGKIVSKNPWFRSPPPYAELFDVKTNIRISVDEPEIKDILFQPSLALQLDKKWNSTWQSNVSYGYKPINQLLLTYSFHLQSPPDGSQYADVKVRPVFPYEHISTVESTASVGNWQITPSLTYQKPQIDDVDPKMIAQDYAPATTVSLNASWRDSLVHKTSSNRFYTGVIKVYEKALHDRGDQALEKSQFERRFSFYEAVRAGYENSKSWSRGRALRTAFELTYDRAQQGALFTSQMDYTFVKDLQVGVKMNLIGSLGNADTEYDRAFLRYYRANDNVGVNLSYVY